MHKELLDFHHKIYNLELQLNSTPEVCRRKRYLATALRRIGELSPFSTNQTTLEYFRASNVGPRTEAILMLRAQIQTVAYQSNDDLTVNK